MLKLGHNPSFGPLLVLTGRLGEQFRERIGTAAVPVFAADDAAFCVDGRRLPREARVRFARWILETTGESLEQMLRDLEAGKVLLPFTQYEVIRDDPLAWG